ncbi:MAG: hypothetical protein ACRDA3_16125 [Peptostreptococcaceae bacterium]
MKSTKIIKTMAIVILVVASILGYSSLFGNPISYVKAKKEINAYIDKNYNNELVIKDINYSSKFNGYNAVVSHKNDGNESYITYHNTGYISDGYQFEVRLNMEEEVKRILEALITQGTDLTINNIGVEPSIELPEFKYHLNDRYLGEEPINLQVWLHPDYGNHKDGKEKNYNYEVPLYNNEDEFIKGAYEVVKVLKNTKYKFNNVEIYSYQKDGKTSYRVKIQEDDYIKSLEELKNKVFIQASEKEESIEK